MKNRKTKSTLAVALVVAVLGGMKTYASYNSTESNILLSDNVEALSDQGDQVNTYNNMHIDEMTYYKDGSKKKDGCSCCCWTQENCYRACHSHGKSTCCSYYEQTSYMILKNLC